MYQGSGPAVVSKEVVPPAPVLGLMDVDVDQDSASQGQVLPPALAQPLPSLGFMDVDGDSSLPVPSQLPVRAQRLQSQMIIHRHQMLPVLVACKSCLALW